MYTLFGIAVTAAILYLSNIKNTKKDYIGFEIAMFG
jgi:hypothetical protein